MEYFLEEFERGHKTHRHRITQPKIVVGRGKGCQINIIAIGVSREHFSINFEHGQFKLLDLGASNKTIVNGRPQNECILRHGDEIIVGELSLTFLLPDETAVFDSDGDELREPGTGIYELKNQKKLKWLVLPTVGIIILGILISFLFQSGGSSGINCDSAFDIIEVSPEITFGNGKANVLCKKQVSFNFLFKGGRVFLKYEVAGSPSSKSFIVKANGNFLAFGPKSEAWSELQIIEVSRNYLKGGKNNILSFEMKGSDRWAVSAIELVENPLPSFDYEKAREYFVHAQKNYENYLVSPGNLFKALKSIQAARDYLELMPQKKDLYYRVDSLYEKIQKKLDKIYKQYVLEVQRAIQFNQYKEAHSILDKMILEFPKKEDYRNERITYMIRNLNQILQSVEQE